MSKTTTFEHGGRIYEARAIPTLNGWMVRIFIDGIPANGFTYSVNSEIYQDAALNRVPEDLVAGLTTISRRKSINSNHESAPVSKSLALSREIQKRKLTPREGLPSPHGRLFSRRATSAGRLDRNYVRLHPSTLRARQWSGAKLSVSSA